MYAGETALLNPREEISVELMPMTPFCHTIGTVDHDEKNEFESYRKKFTVLSLPENFLSPIMTSRESQLANRFSWYRAVRDFTHISRSEPVSRNERPQDKTLAAPRPPQESHRNGRPLD